VNEIKIHMFGRLTADGRLRRVEQLSGDVSGRDPGGAAQPAWRAESRPVSAHPPGVDV